MRLVQYEPYQTEQQSANDMICTLMYISCVRFLFRETDIFTQQGCIKLIKSDSTDFYVANIKDIEWWCK